MRFVGLPPEQQFSNRVQPGEPDECWEWAGPTNNNGYGVLESRYLNGKVGAHRYAYARVNGPIPDGMQVCHTCDNRRCCNPSHLFLGTHADNQRDKVAKGRQMKAEAVPGAKLTMAKATTIRILYARGHHTVDSLASIYGVSPSAVRGLLRGKAWRDSPTFCAQLAAVFGRRCA